MHKALALIGALMVVGCGGDDDGGGSSKSTPGAATGPCAERLGSYLLHYEEQANGSCGPITDQVVTLTKTPPVNTCTGPTEVSADGCTVALDVTCPEPNLGKGYTSNNSGTVRWSEDGSTAEGTVSITVRPPGSGAAECRSVYKVTYRRQ